MSARAAHVPPSCGRPRQYSKIVRIVSLSSMGLAFCAPGSFSAHSRDDASPPPAPTTAAATLADLPSAAASAIEPPRPMALLGPGAAMHAQPRADMMKSSAPTNRRPAREIAPPATPARAPSPARAHFALSPGNLRPNRHHTTPKCCKRRECPIAPAKTINHPRGHTCA